MRECCVCSADVELLAKHDAKRHMDHVTVRELIKEINQNPDVTICFNCNVYKNFINAIGFIHDLK